MIILGICFGYHDSSVCIIKDGEIIFSSEEERFTYLKHDSSFPLFSLQYGLKKYGINSNDIDHVIFGENPYQKFLSRIDTFIHHDFTSLTNFISLTKKWLGNNLWSVKKISDHLNISLDKISYIDHHEAHHISALYQSNFKNSYSLVLDSIGQNESISLYLNNTLIKTVPFNNSLCYLYSLVTNWLGFSPNSSECTTMALSSFGKEMTYNPFEALVHFIDGEIVINKELLNLNSMNSKLHIKQIEKILGTPRTPQENLDLSCFRSSNPQSHYADIALAMQDVFEDTIISFLNYHCEDKEITNLCISGGGAHNCKLIRKINENTHFANIFIPQAPGDAGLALGAALSKCGRIKLNTPLNFNLGSHVDLEEIKDLILNLSENDLKNYTSDHNKFSNLEILKLDQVEHSRFIANKIDEGKIIAIAQGQAEFGPRALGARSIICRSDSTEIATKISKTIKKRASYRPYALSTTLDKAKEIFDCEHIDTTFYGMQTDVKIHDNFKNEVIGAIHIDQTTRPQIATPDTFFHDIISNTKNKIVLNTSLNESGYPLCKSAKEAFLLFLKTPIDMIILENLLVIKK